MTSDNYINLAPPSCEQNSDGEKIHTYAPVSDHDCQSCSYCLKRTRGDSTWYCHMIVVASLVCPGGFKLPLYVHPVRARSVQGKETSSDDTHKQECELSAFKAIIPTLRERFPRLKMCALLDSLYANGPILRKDHHSQWKREGRLLGMDCGMEDNPKKCPTLSRKRAFEVARRRSV